MVRALRDPDGANLDRIQIVKGWLEADRSLQGKVYGVIWASTCRFVRGMAGEGTSFPEWRSRNACPQAGMVRAPPSRSAE